MSRDKISEWSSTAGSNTDVGGININEGCPPATINNGSITGSATLTGSSVVTYSGDASISATGTVIANGHIQGDNWTIVPVTPNTWKRIG